MNNNYLIKQLEYKIQLLQSDKYENNTYTKGKLKAYKDILNMIKIGIV